MNQRHRQNKGDNLPAPMNVFKVQHREDQKTQHTEHCQNLIQKIRRQHIQMKNHPDKARQHQDIQHRPDLAEAVQVYPPPGLLPSGFRTGWPIGSIRFIAFIPHIRSPFPTDFIHPGVMRPDVPVFSFTDSAAASAAPVSPVSALHYTGLFYYDDPPVSMRHNKRRPFERLLIIF